jgi:hypothetical protein
VFENKISKMKFIGVLMLCINLPYN